MFLRLLLLMTVVPIVELRILLWVKDQTSWSATIALVVLTGLIGATLARLQGWRIVERIQRELADGRMPATAMGDGLLILIAGVVLITPGLLTDALGFALLVPPLRKGVRGYLWKRLERRFVFHTDARTAPWEGPGPVGQPRHDEIIDARVIDEDSDSDRRRDSS